MIKYCGKVCKYADINGNCELDYPDIKNKDSEFEECLSFEPEEEE